MKTLKDRNTVKISVAAYEQMRDEIFQTALRDVTGDDAISYLRKEYNIDIDILDLEVKSDSN